MIRKAVFGIVGALALAQAAPGIGLPDQNGVSAPFMQVTLRMAPFKGADAAQTRAKAMAFLSTTGYRVLDYQDNEALRAATVTPPASGQDGPADLINGFKWMFEKAKLLRALRSQPDVSGVDTLSGGRLIVLFNPFVYLPQAEKLRAILPPGYHFDYYLNPAMSGIWVRLDVSGIKDPRAAAADLAQRYPYKVARAEIMVSVRVMNAGAH